MNFYNEIRISPWSHIVAIGSMMLFLLLSACTDAGDRNNIHDYDGDSYAYGDDLYYLNRDGKGFDGEIRKGQVTGTYFVYKNEWRAATVLEIDTYDYLADEPWPLTKDAENRWGAIHTDNCYVFESYEWRAGTHSDCSLNLQGCTELRQNFVGQGSDDDWYKCDSLVWRKATDIEKDTVTWGEGKFNGEIRVGKINKDIYYIYKSDNKAWREATDLEKDTYNYDKKKPWSAGKESDSKWGAVNTVYCYVFEDSVWRAGTMYDCSLGLRGCTARRQDTVALGSLENAKAWYKCDSLSWRSAMNIEKDTATWGAGKFDGEIRVGKVNKDIHYIYESGKKAWREASVAEKDMYDYKKNQPWAAGKDGAMKKGAVTDTVYVFDSTAWRVADKIEKALGLCMSTIQDSVGIVDGVTYVCQKRAWEPALGSCAPSSETVERNVPVVWTFSHDMKNSGLGPNEVQTAKYSWNLPGGSPVTSGDKRVVQTTYMDVGTKTATVSVTAGGRTSFAKCTVNVKFSDVEEKLGVCSSAMQDSVGKAGLDYYICDEKSWRNATTYEKDTYGWNKEEKATVRKGNVSDTFYVYENEIFRIANAREVYIKEGCTDYNEGSINVKSDTSDYVCKQGVWQIHKNVLIDERDGQSYQTVRIGSQVWMAQDLNYADSIKTENLKGASWCEYDKEICDYRLYTWNAIMDYPSDYFSSEKNYGSTKGICPDNWHVPSDDEWLFLFNFLGGNDNASHNLRDWGEPIDQKNLDTYGFSARCNSYATEKYGNDLVIDCESWYPDCGDGCLNNDGMYFESGYFECGQYWTSSEKSYYDKYTAAKVIDFGYADVVFVRDFSKKGALAVRCVKDE